MPMMVIDPASVLPQDILVGIDKSIHGVLWVLEEKVSIHPQTLKRIFEKHPGEPVYYVPKIPIASKYGIPAYKPMLYWFPLKTKEDAIYIGKNLQQDFMCSIELSKAKEINETSTEEQIHYFVDNFQHICPKPLQVSVIVGNSCNLKCIMCPYHSPEVSKRHKTDYFKQTMFMSSDMMDKIASECGALKIPVKMGNVEEPLLHPGIHEFVKKCRLRGVPTVHITTNGTKLNRDISVKLLDSGLTSLYVSLDAYDSDTYKRIRGKELRQVELNIYDFIKVRDEGGYRCQVYVSIIRNREVTESELDDFIKQWVEIVDGVIVYRLAEIEANGAALFVNTHNTVSDQTGIITRWPCPGPFQEVYLLPDGRVYYCCETISRLAYDTLPSMGSYPKQKLRDIWVGEHFQKLRRDLITHHLDEWKACKNCNVWMANDIKTEKRDGLKIISNVATEIIQKNV